MNNKFVHVVDDKYYKVKFGEDNKIILTDELDETLETIDSDDSEDDDEEEEDDDRKKLREDDLDDDSTDDEEEGKKVLLDKREADLDIREDDLDKREADLDTREADLEKELDKKNRSERKRKRNSEDDLDSDSDDEDDTEKKKLKQQIEQQEQQIKQQDEQIKQQCEEMKQLEAKLQQEREQFQNIPNKQALLQLSTQNPELFTAYVTCMTSGFDSNNGSGDDKRNAVEKMEALGHKGQPLRQVLAHLSTIMKEQKYEYLVQDREKAYQEGLAPFKDELHVLDEEILNAKKSKKEQEDLCDAQGRRLAGLPSAERQRQLKPYVDNLRYANTAYDNKLQEMKECHEKINTQLVELKENTERKTKYKLVANTPEGRQLEWSNRSKFDAVKPARLQMPTEEE